MVKIPAVGRIVHYVSYGTPPDAAGTQAYRSECRAAIITEVTGDTVGLFVLNPTGTHHRADVHEGEMAGTWHWPELS